MDETGRANPPTALQSTCLGRPDVVAKTNKTITKGRIPPLPDQVTDRRLLTIKARDDAL